MKRILIAVLLLSLISLASAREVTIHLNAGLNFIGVPVDQGGWHLSDLAEYIGDVNLIVSHDAETGFESFVPGSTPDDSPRNIEIKEGEAYLIIMAEEKNVTFTGTLWNEDGVITLDLKRGLNMVSIPPDSGTEYTAKEFFDLTGATLIIRHNPDDGKFETLTTTSSEELLESTPIEEGMGYIVNVGEDKIVEIDTLPTVISATLDYNTGVLVVTLSETIDADKTVPGRFHLNDKTGTNDVTLTDATVSEGDATTITFTLREEERVAALKISGSVDGTPIVLDVDVGAVKDMTGLPIAENDNNPVAEIADTTPPTVITAALDYNTGELVVTFSETIDASETQPEKFHINDVTGTDDVTLTQPPVDVNSEVLSFTLTEEQRVAALAISRSVDGTPVVLDVDANAVKDMAGNELTEDDDNNPVTEVVQTVSIELYIQPVNAVYFVGDKILPKDSFIKNNMDIDIDVYITTGIRKVDCIDDCTYKIIDNAKHTLSSKGILDISQLLTNDVAYFAAEEDLWGRFEFFIELRGEYGNLLVNEYETLEKSFNFKVEYIDELGPRVSLILPEEESLPFDQAIPIKAYAYDILRPDMYTYHLDALVDPNERFNLTVTASTEVSSKRLPLYDDGNHFDEQANDNIYGNVLKPNTLLSTPLRLSVGATDEAGNGGSSSRSISIEKEISPYLTLATTSGYYNIGDQISLSNMEEEFRSFELSDYSIYPVDSDDNGKYESINIDLDLNIIRKSPLRIYVDRSGSSFGYLYSKDIYPDDEGSYPHSIQMEPGYIITGKLDGPYNLSLTIRDEFGETPIFSQNIILSKDPEYVWDDFELPAVGLNKAAGVNRIKYPTPIKPSGKEGFTPNKGGIALSGEYITFTGNYDPTGDDKDGDGLYDTLNVEFEVDVIKAGEYYLSGTLRDESGDTIDSDYTDGYLPLEAGLNTITLEFEGYDIYRSNQDGPYILSYLGATEYETQQTTRVRNISIADGFRYDEFQPPDVFIIRDDYTVLPVDPDQDNLIDYLEFQFKARIFEEDCYYFTIRDNKRGYHYHLGCYPEGENHITAYLKPESLNWEGTFNITYIGANVFMEVSRDHRFTRDYIQLKIETGYIKDDFDNDTLNKADIYFESIEYSPEDIYEGQMVSLVAKIKNQGETDSGVVNVFLYEDEELIYQGELENLAEDEEGEITVERLSYPQRYRVDAYLFLDNPENEFSAKNNIYRRYVPQRLGVLPKSQILLPASETASGYLLVKILKLDENLEWQDYQTIFEDESSRTIQGGEPLSLDSFWSGISADSLGTYKIYAALRNENGEVITVDSYKLENEYIFHVVEELVPSFQIVNPQPDYFQDARIVFDASPSTGDIQGYYWRIELDGEVVAAEETYDPGFEHTLEDAGTYTVILELKGDSEFSDPYSEEITIEPSSAFSINTHAVNFDSIEGKGIWRLEYEISSQHPLKGSYPIAEISDSHGMIAKMKLYDDGRYADDTADDGIYAAELHMDDIFVGDYTLTVQVEDIYGNNITYESTESISILQKDCDGIPDDSCDPDNLPLYCNDGHLFNNCDECGCPSGVCNMDGGCFDHLNSKRGENYQDRTAFIISNSNWRNVLATVPVVSWNQRSDEWCNEIDNRCVYPFLIYYDKGPTEALSDINLFDFLLKLTIDGKNYYYGGPYEIDKREYCPTYRLYRFRVRDKDLCIYNVSFEPEDLSLGDSSVFKFTAENILDQQVSISEIELDLTIMNEKLTINENIESGDSINLEIPLSVRSDVSFFDVDSVIHFLRQYKPDYVRILDDSPSELDNLLVSPEPNGAGIEADLIEKIEYVDYMSYLLSYWDFYNSIIVVDYDNYEDGLIASHYAAISNAPLLFLNEDNIELYGNVFSNKFVTVVGDVDCSVMDMISENSNAYETLTQEDLQLRIIGITNPDKAIIVNPEDISIHRNHPFVYGDNAFFTRIYGQTSLLSPYLSTAKEEIIIPIKEKGKIITAGNPDCQSYTNSFVYFDRLINYNLMKYLDGYPEFLTILASPIAIPDADCYDGRYNIMWDHLSDGKEQVDWMYGQDRYESSHLGRIYSISISDVSSYLGRSIFILELMENVYTGNPEYSGLAIGHSFEEDEEAALNITQDAEQIGYGVDCFVQTDGDKYPGCEKNVHPDESFYSKRHFIAFLDHGWESGWYLTLLTPELPPLDLSYGVGDACLTNAFFESRGGNLFSANWLRKGGIAYTGSVEVSWICYDGTMKGKVAIKELIENPEQTLGEFQSKLIEDRDVHCKRLFRPKNIFKQHFTLLGDPTLQIPLKEVP